jgi:hypothetical protein
MDVSICGFLCCVWMNFGYVYGCFDMWIFMLCMDELWKCGCECCVS